MSQLREFFNNPQRLKRLLARPEGKILAGALLGIMFFALALGYQYHRYAKVVDQQLEANPFSDTLNFYAAPKTVAPGEKIQPDDLTDSLYRIGYREQEGFRGGWFKRTKKTVEVHPRQGSEFASGAARLEFSNGKIARIVSIDGKKLDTYQFDPELIANVTPDREKRRMVRFGELPKSMIDAIIATEDKRFFDHGGLDMLRLAKAAYVDLKEGRKEQGASTITMQLARSLWLDNAKNWQRKLREVIIAKRLEDKFSKQQIFEFYVNEVYLGRRGTYSIHGIGQAAWEYFGKDVRQLTLPEAALLAGLIQRPSYFDPFRYPDRARQRRDLVLRLMRNNGLISAKEYRDATAQQIQVSPPEARPSEAPYFMDLLTSELQHRFQDHAIHVRNVHSTIDADLQRAASEAVRLSLPKLDKLAARTSKDGVKPEVALVALDPRTGEIKALVGGRNYQRSQLNRVLARRPVGSTFKPFVYAAALGTALNNQGDVLTPATLVDDSPATFEYGDEQYNPGNFQQTSYGVMTLRQALVRSDNIAAVKVAETVGYKRVADLARSAGLVTARGTPAVALGAYDATPLELAGAYTVFANQGDYVKPALVREVLGPNGQVVFRHQPERRALLDRRVAFLMQNMMEGVMNNGTGFGARAAGFTLPAAGKTGTSRDGWFAGFTSNLLTVVWVGYDDYRDLRLEGAKSALPIWTEFMKRAHKLPRYADAKPFPIPSGLVTAEIDPESGQLASPSCWEARSEYFIAGTEPSSYCDLHGHTAELAMPGYLAPVQPVAR
ncbi:MAG TPA: PBP1A family penicillin-binding protein [Bryobacteraceae bacterium]|nr:PBP1A family penicillin-binding protein [Bryobacteraceae bacterium]